MRVVFMGTPDFAARVLVRVASAHEVVAVYTRPDAVRGRGKALVPSPVKEEAAARGIPVLTPRTLRTPEAAAELAALAPDVVCVAAYGAILPKEILDVPPFGCLNVHGSLLPRWRGAAPIERAILAGDEEAGVCVMEMEEGLDTGAYCICRAVPVAGKDAATLTAELAEAGGEALVEALDELASGRALPWTPQDETAVTYAEKVAKGELDLDPNATVEQNARRVRASGEAHPSRCVIAGRPVTVLSCAPLPAGSPAAGPAAQAAPGDALVAAKRLVLACADGALEVTGLKPDGKKPMDGRAFAAGCPALRDEKGTWSCA
ncbi:MAG: methionyl-tRNA formyltransferase [Eggerthellaceae bacterium]|nr:methionyl-tRNA formyltransferase [Eggerthellaceae bacterium]